MLELIARLRAQLDSEVRDFGPTPQTRGMHDLLLAMEARVSTIQNTLRHSADPEVALEHLLQSA